MSLGILAGETGGLPNQPIDPTLIVEKILPELQIEITKLLEAAIRTATTVLAQKVSASTSVLISAGLPRGLHGQVDADLVIGGTVGSIVSGAGAIFRVALLPQRRAELLFEIHTPTLDKLALIALINKEMKKLAGIYIMTPLKNFFESQGKYGKYIYSAISKFIKPDILADVVSKVIMRLPI